MTNLQKIQLSISEIDLSISEIEHRLNTIRGQEGQPELLDPLVSEWLSAESRLEVEALLTKRTGLLTKRTDLERRRAALVTEGEHEARLADERNRT